MSTRTNLEPTRPATTSPLIELSGVEKVFKTGDVEYRALRGIDLTIGSGEMPETPVRGVPVPWPAARDGRGLPDPAIVSDKY